MRHTRRGIGKVVRSLAALLLMLGVGFGAGSFVGRAYQQATQAEQAAPTSTAHNQQAASYHAWDQEADANYYRVLGPASVGAQPDPGTVVYGELDGLGRTTGVVATVTTESMRAGLDRVRGDMSSIEPSGWGHNREVDIPMPNGTIYHGFLFNRSHLVAKSLGGDDATHNLITGTRTQNVGANVNGTDGGMAYAEGLARGWLATHPDGWVYYAATPLYEGKELVARSVVVDVRSSDGSVDERVEVFNAARGFEIDYATGSFTQTEDARAAAEQIRQGLGESARENAGETEAQTPESVVTVGSSESADGERMVIVTGSGKAYHHDETCSGLTNARSMEWVSVSEAEAMGRHPCGICGG